MARFSFSGFFKDVGIDLGTANSLIYLKNRGIVIQEPSVVAVNQKTNQILAVGEDAKKMLGRTPAHIQVIRPLVNGVISDFEMAEEILRKLHRRGVDGIIIEPVFDGTGPSNLALLDELARAGMPFVLLDNYYPGSAYTRVVGSCHLSMPSSTF